MIFSMHDALMGLLGGGLIGLASAVLLLGAGRIAGISGLAAQAMQGGREAAAFVVGLAGAPALWALAVGPPAIGVTTALPALVAGGLLVGFGTRLGSGCTSGHGVCGLSRLSPRSLAATAAFMAVAAAVVAGARMAPGG